MQRVYMEQLPEHSVKIKGSTVLFGPYEYQCAMAQLQPQFIIIKISKVNSNSGSVQLQLSFKHIHRVEILDNQDDKGAGLVIHVNSFMAEKIQETLDSSKRGFVDFRVPYSPNSFIVMDILNPDPHTITKIKDTLYLCEQFHRNYVTEMCIKSNKPITDDALPVMYISTISFNQWKTLLGLFHKDLTFEHIEGQLLGTQRQLKYTIGKIVPYVQDIYSIQRDGRLVRRTASHNDTVEPKRTPTTMRSAHDTTTTTSKLLPKSPARSTQPVCLLINRPTPAQQQQQNYANQQLAYHSNQTSHQSAYGGDYRHGGAVEQTLNISKPANTASTYNAFVTGNSQYNNNNVSNIPLPASNRPLLRRAAANSQKREVHVIEDEEESADDASTSKKRNDTIFVYPPSGAHSCSVHYSDLKYLDYSYMLNDTIIDFYLKYIYHELIPEERRKKIFMFNSFFYSRLSQPPSNSKPYLSASNRWKRVQPNYQFVKSWTKKVNLFDMDYIVVPINEDIHWYLAIIVNPKRGIVGDVSEPSTSLPSDGPTKTNGAACDTKGNNVNEANRPYVIVLDSLIDGDRKHGVVRDILAEYLSLEYEDKKAVMNLPGKSFSKASTRLVTPSGTPQQKNYVDCGLFLLEFAEIFMRNPPKTISTRVSFGSWYPDFHIKGKRSKIQAIIRQMASHVKSADFLPPNATPTFRKKEKSKKKSSPPLDILMPPLRTRRHSDTSIWEYEKEKQFTSLDLSALGRSLDSIIGQLREMPPVVITFRDSHPKRKKTAPPPTPTSTAVTAAESMPAVGANVVVASTTSLLADPLSSLSTARPAVGASVTK